MQQYSIVVSIYGWSAKNLLTGKELVGNFSVLPGRVSQELHRLMTPSENSLCIASTVTIPESNEFHTWFSKQPIYPTR